MLCIDVGTFSAIESPTGSLASIGKGKVPQRRVVAIAECEYNLRHYSTLVSSGAVELLEPPCVGLGVAITTGFISGGVTNKWNVWASFQD